MVASVLVALLRRQATPSFFLKELRQSHWWVLVRTGTESTWGPSSQARMHSQRGEPAGTRTQGPRLKRAMLYQLSYRLTVRNAVIQSGDCQPPRDQELPRQPARNAVDGENTSADCAV